MPKPASVDAYIADFPEATRAALKQMRVLVRETAPQAEESISYAMPGYKLNGKPLVYYAGYKNHIGFYATPTGYGPFQEDLSKYKQGKGSVQFPLTDPLPVDLIRRIIEYRVKQVGGEAG